MDARSAAPLTIGVFGTRYRRSVVAPDSPQVPAYYIVAAKTGMASAAMETIADTANLIRRILRVRVPVQS